MNVVFVYPEYENLGVEYLSACLKKAGHHVKLVFDPMLFTTYYFKSDLLKKLFSYKMEVIRKVLDSNGDLVCFSVFSDYYGWASDIALELKKRNNGIRIVFGGVHPSSVPEIVINEPFADYVCIGEGEGPLVELADCLEQGQDGTAIKNIWAKKNGTVFRNELRPLVTDLDALPFPDKDLFKEEYKHLLGEVYAIITSRGCPNACTYCHNSYFRKLYHGKGPYLRRRSVDHVIAELVQAKERHHMRRVAFLDDLFIYDLNWLDDFAEKYQKKVGLPYFCHVHPSWINEKAVQLLKSSGCSTVTMGIQTVDEGIRKEILDRHDSRQQIENAIRLIMKSGVFLYTNTIFGLPQQNRDVMIEEVRFANRFRVDIPASNWLRYYPGTEIIKIAKSQGLLTEKEIDAIEASKEYLPYSMEGTTWNKDGAKLRNMLLLTHVLPASFVDYMLERKWYRFLPTANLRFYLQMIIITSRRISLKRDFPFTHVSLLDILRYYAHYMLKKLKRS